MKRPLPLCVVLGLLMLAVANPARADEPREADYYVATDGSDENPGRERLREFRSLSAGQVRILALGKGSLEARESVSDASVCHNS